MNTINLTGTINVTVYELNPYSVEELPSGLLDLHKFIGEKIELIPEELRMPAAKAADFVRTTQATNAQVKAAGVASSVSVANEP